MPNLTDAQSKSSGEQNANEGSNHRKNEVDHNRDRPNKEFNSRDRDRHYHQFQNTHQHGYRPYPVPYGHHPRPPHAIYPQPPYDGSYYNQADNTKNKSGYNRK